MKSSLALLAVVALLTTSTVIAQDTQAKAAPTFANNTDKVSYAIGVDIAGNFKKQGIDINPEQFAKGLADAWAGSKVLLTDEEVKATLTAFQNELKTKMQEKAKAAGEKNKADGATFLAANKVKAGVMTTASGLQYKVVKEGAGAKPTPEDTVSVNYKGTLIDGTEFDSSYKRNQPATFTVKGVIPGWTEALQLMTVGSTYQLFIPAELAYGERGAGNTIGPNSTLIFDVELLSIEKK
jgi:FKBP-type peptidyl-prolyl cis-trans isomerase FklB